MVNPCCAHKRAASNETKMSKAAAYVVRLPWKNLDRAANDRSVSRGSICPPQNRANGCASAIHIPTVWRLDPHQGAATRWHIPIRIRLRPESDGRRLAVAREQSRGRRHLHSGTCAASRAEGNRGGQKARPHKRLKHPKKLLAHADLVHDPRPDRDPLQPEAATR